MNIHTPVFASAHRAVAHPRTRVSLRPRLLAGLAGLAALLITASGLVLSTPAHAASALESIRERGYIRIGMEGTFVPYGYHDESGELVGFEKEIGDAVAGDLGVEPRYVETEWDSLIAGLDVGRYDIIINSISPTPQRRASYAFTEPYSALNAQVAVTTDSPISSLADIAGRSCAQTASSHYGQAATDAGAQIVASNGFSESIQLVEQGRADCTINDVVTMNAYRKDHPSAPLRFIDAPEIADTPAAIMLPQGADDLREALNASLEKHRLNGDFAEIFRSYTGTDLTPSEQQIAESGTAENGDETGAIARSASLAWHSAPRLLAATVGVTIPLTVVSFAIALVLAILTAQARLSPWRPLRAVAWAYVWVFRGTPALVQLFIVFYGLPSIGLTLNAWVAAIIALSLNTGAYASEAIRSAQLAIPKGQWEAARAHHLSHMQTLRHVIAPQIWRIAVPPLGNELINLLKTTSLVSVITLADVFQVSQQITAREFAPLVLYSEVALIFLVLCTALSAVQSALEAHTSRYVIQ